MLKLVKKSQTSTTAIPSRKLLAEHPNTTRTAVKGNIMAVEAAAGTTQRRLASTLNSRALWNAVPPRNPPGQRSGKHKASVEDKMAVEATVVTARRGSGLVMRCTDGGRCSKNHELAITASTLGQYAKGWVCDICGLRARVGACRGHCEECHWDACQACFAALVVSPSSWDQSGEIRDWLKGVANEFPGMSIESMQVDDISFRITRIKREARMSLRLRLRMWYEGKASKTPASSLTKVVPKALPQTPPRTQSPRRDQTPSPASKTPTLAVINWREEVARCNSKGALSSLAKVRALHCRVIRDVTLSQLGKFREDHPEVIILENKTGLEMWAKSQTKLKTTGKHLQAIQLQRSTQAPSGGSPRLGSNWLRDRGLDGAGTTMAGGGNATPHVLPRLGGRAPHSNASRSKKVPHSTEPEERVRTQWNGRNVFSPPGKGNCFFQCWARHLGHGASAQSVRRRICDFIEQHPGKYTKGCGCCSGEDGTHIRRMRNDNCWNTAAEIAAAQDVFGIRLVIIDAVTATAVRGVSRVQPVRPGNSSPFLRVLFESKHYSILDDDGKPEVGVVDVVCIDCGADGHDTAQHEDCICHVELGSTQ